MKNELLDRQEKVLKQLMAISGARRGQLSKQYYKRKTPKGKTVCYGPYYVWQRYVNGKKRSVRVRADQVEQVKDELESGKKVNSLFEELWSILEEAAEKQQTAPSKKKPRQ